MLHDLAERRQDPFGAQRERNTEHLRAGCRRCRTVQDLRYRAVHVNRRGRLQRGQCRAGRRADEGAEQFAEHVAQDVPPAVLILAGLAEDGRLVGEHVQVHIHVQLRVSECGVDAGEHLIAELRDVARNRRHDSGDIRARENLRVHRQIVEVVADELVEVDAHPSGRDVETHSGPAPCGREQFGNGSLQIAAERDRHRGISRDAQCGIRGDQRGVECCREFAVPSGESVELRVRIPDSLRDGCRDSGECGAREGEREPVDVVVAIDRLERAPRIRGDGADRELQVRDHGAVGTADQLVERERQGVGRVGLIRSDGPALADGTAGADGQAGLLGASVLGERPALRLGVDHRIRADPDGADVHGLGSQQADPERVHDLLRALRSAVPGRGRCEAGDGVEADAGERAGEELALGPRRVGGCGARCGGCRHGEGADDADGAENGGRPGDDGFPD